MQAGDFNSLPGSGAYRLITERALSMNDAHAFVSPEDQNIGVRLPYPMLAHEFKLESAYRTIYGKEPMYGNFDIILGPVLPFSAHIAPLNYRSIHTPRVTCST